jgi:hypothetical protein
MIITKLMLHVCADENDADYVYEDTEITEKDQPLIRKVAEAVKSCPQRHNWPNNEHARGLNVFALYADSLTVPDIEKFDEYVPGENGVHTIKKIEIRAVTVLEKLL